MFNADTQPDLNGLLDLVALGTVADVVPLDAVNRRLVEALRRMRDGKACAGVNALFEVAKRDVTRATACDLASCSVHGSTQLAGLTTSRWASSA